MINITRFIIKNPKMLVEGLKGYLKQPLTPRMFQIIMQYINRTKLMKLFPWVKTGSFTAGFPVEFGRAFDVFPYYPEAYAALTGSAECTLPSIEHAESLGYSKDLCSYMKTSIGASRLKWPEDFGGNEPTDMYFSANPVCDTHMKWLENDAKIFGKPHFGLDVPSLVAGEGEERLEEYIDYVEEQLWDLIRFLEKHTGKKFNENKFLKTIDKSAEISRLFMDVYDYRKRFPANRYFEWVRLFMLPMVCQWNENDAVRFYKKHLEMAKKRYGDNKVIESGREKYRVAWEGITIWYKVDLYKKVLAEKGAKIVAESYTDSFPLRKKSAGPTVSATLRQIARELMTVPYTLNIDERIKYFDKLISDYDLDGIIMLANQSCRPQSTGLQDLRDALVEKWGIPVLILNTDHCDPRAYAEGPINTRIDGFIEMMEAKNKRTGKAA
jgi:benzoyl-CoA reductase/2-hydroxyglutaryl-CoA dehydratase subunit BcrC/BadD/HgdB